MMKTGFQFHFRFYASILTSEHRLQAFRFSETILEEEIINRE